MVSFLFFFKQKTAYEMRISDWSSDVCSSDLKAFASWSQTTREQRLDVLLAIQAEYARRQNEIGEAITEEMGAPNALGCGFHIGLGGGHIAAAIDALKTFKFEELRGQTMIRREPIGVCAMITPWNWPMNQVAVQVLPALATGCTMVLKPPQLDRKSTR